VQKNQSKLFGNQSEELALGFLQQNGFRIIDRNFYAKKMGEIDIIAIKDDIIHFIEVKSSFSNSFEPIYNITPLKLRKIVKSSQYYLQQKKLIHLAFSIDALIIKNREIEMFENITL